MKRSIVSHLVNDVGVEEHHAEVVDDHGGFEVVGFAVGHVAWPDIQYEKHIAQQEEGHLDRALHQWVIPYSFI